MNEMYLVHIFRCSIIIYRMLLPCTQYLYCTRYKQYNQSNSAHDKICVLKYFGSYLNQFSTDFDGPGTEIDGNMCRNVIQQHGVPWRIDCNWF
jgi:hypothetical protein